MHASLLKELRAQLVMQGQGIGGSLLEGGCLRGGLETGHHTDHIFRGLPKTEHEAPVY